MSLFRSTRNTGTNNIHQVERTSNLQSGGTVTSQVSMCSHRHWKRLVTRSEPEDPECRFRVSPAIEIIQHTRGRFWGRAELTSASDTGNNERAYV